MKRCRFGLILLAALLILGIASTWVMNRRSGPVARLVEQSGELALAGDWERAEELLRRAKGEWEASFAFCATLSDHEPMERINGQFARLEVFTRCRDAVHFAETSAQLSEDVKAIGEAHRLTWWNLL